MRRDPRVVLFLLLLMMVCLNADQMVMSPNIAEIKREFGIEDSAIGAIQGAFTVVGALVSLAWGYMADRFSRKRLLLFGVLVGEIPCFLSAFVQSYPQLFLTRALTGIGVGAVFPVVFSFAGDAYDELQRGKINAFLSTAFAIGAIAGMVVAGFMGATYGWRTPFLVVSLPNIVLVIFFVLIAEEPARGAAEVGVGALVEQGIAYRSQVSLSDYLDLFRIRTNLVLFFQGVLGTIPWGAIPYYMVYFLEGSRGLTKEGATMVFIFFGVGSVAGIFVGGVLGGLLYKRKPGYMPLLCSVTTAAGALFVLVTLNLAPVGPMDGLVMLSALGFLASATASMTGPNVKTMLMNVNEPENRGRIFSIFNLTDSLGTGMGQFLGGVLSTAFGSIGAAMNISALFWLPCSAILLVAVFALPRDAERLRRQMLASAEAMRSEAGMSEAAISP